MFCTQVVGLICTYEVTWLHLSTEVSLSWDLWRVLRRYYGDSRANHLVWYRVLILWIVTTKRCCGKLEKETLDLPSILSSTKMYLCCQKGTYRHSVTDSNPSRWWIRFSMRAIFVYLCWLNKWSQKTTQMCLYLPVLCSGDCTLILLFLSLFLFCSYGKFFAKIWLLFPMGVRSWLRRSVIHSYSSKVMACPAVFV